MGTGNGLVGRLGAVLFVVLVVWALIDRQPPWVTIFFAFVAVAFGLTGAAAKNYELRRRGPVCSHCDQPLPKDHDPECEECGDRGCLD